MEARKQRSDEATAEILLEQLKIMRANVDGAIAGKDPEPLHDLRVALRRSRSVLKGFPGVFTRADHERFKIEFKELQAITGPVRDYDVLLEAVDQWTEQRPQFADDAGALRTVLVRKRSAAQSKLKRRLNSKRFRDLLGEWQATLESLKTPDGASGDDADAAIGKLARARIDADRKRFLELGRKALSSGDPAEIHHVRKRGKSLRYNLEFFGRLGHKKKAKHLLRQLKKAQDELGDYQDTVVREAALREAAESAGTIRVAAAAGAMIERALAERAERFDRFGARFEKLD